jgi:chloramphenicol 3-O-phosphotransferase
VAEYVEYLEDGRMPERTVVILRGTMGAGKSSVAERLAEITPLKMVVVEVDDLKFIQFCSSEHSSTESFVDAGKVANQKLREGSLLVVVEAFVEKCWVDLVVRQIEEPCRFVYVWLECPLNIAVERKREFSRDVVSGQFSRYSKRYHHPGEIVVDAERHSVDETARMILKALMGKRVKRSIASLYSFPHYRRIHGDQWPSSWTALYFS